MMFDNKTGGIMALPVEERGVADHVVKWCVRKIDEIGYAGEKIAMKSDQEPAIMAFKKSVAVHREAETSMIESPVRESRSHGAMERALRTWQGQMRTMRSASNGSPNR